MWRTVGSKLAAPWPPSGYDLSPYPSLEQDSCLRKGLPRSLISRPTSLRVVLPVTSTLSLPLLTAPAQTTAIARPMFLFSFPPHLCRLLKRFDFFTGVGPDMDQVIFNLLSLPPCHHSCLFPQPGSLLACALLAARASLLICYFDHALPCSRPFYRCPCPTN